MSEKTHTVTRKIEIYVFESEKEKKDAGYSTLNYYNDTIWRMANDVINHQHFNLLFNERSYQNKESEQVLKWYSELDQLSKANSDARYQDKDIKVKISEIRNEMKTAFYSTPMEEIRNEFMGTSTENTTYRMLRKKFPNVPSMITSSLNRLMYKKYRNDLIEVITGQRALPNFKKGTPIPFMVKMITQLTKIEGNYYTFIWNGIKFKTKLGKDKSNNEYVLDKILANEYKLGDSSIQIDDDKIFLLASVTMPVAINKLSKDKVCGVDLGMATPAYCAINLTRDRMAIGSEEDITNSRVAFKRRRIDLQKALTFTSGGRGRDKKLKKLNDLKANERNWVKTKNHGIAKQVVQFALKNKCATINMEDLASFKDKPNNEFVLRNWGYHELQTMIEQKAKVVGITIKKVPAKYTSQTCNACGNVSDTQRKSQSHFACENEKCKEYNINVHADYNGARNIASL